MISSPIPDPTMDDRLAPPTARRPPDAKIHVRALKLAQGWWWTGGSLVVAGGRVVVVAVRREGALFFSQLEF